MSLVVCNVRFGPKTAQATSSQSAFDVARRFIGEAGDPQKLLTGHSFRVVLDVDASAAMGSSSSSSSFTCCDVAQLCDTLDLLLSMQTTSSGTSNTFNLEVAVLLMQSGVSAGTAPRKLTWYDLSDRDDLEVRDQTNTRSGDSSGPSRLKQQREPVTPPREVVTSSTVSSVLNRKRANRGSSGSYDAASEGTVAAASLPAFVLWTQAGPASSTTAAAAAAAASSSEWKEAGQIPFDRNRRSTVTEMEDALLDHCDVPLGHSLDRMALFWRVVAPHGGGPAGPSSSTTLPYRPKSAIAASAGTVSTSRSTSNSSSNGSGGFHPITGEAEVVALMNDVRVFGWDAVQIYAVMAIRPLLPTSLPAAATTPQQQQRFNNSYNSATPTQSTAAAPAAPASSSSSRSASAGRKSQRKSAAPSSSTAAPLEEEEVDTDVDYVVIQYTVNPPLITVVGFLDDDSLNLLAKEILSRCVSDAVRRAMAASSSTCCFVREPRNAGGGIFPVYRLELSKCFFTEVQEMQLTLTILDTMDTMAAASGGSGFRYVPMDDVSTRTSETLSSKARENTAMGLNINATRVSQSMQQSAGRGDAALRTTTFLFLPR